MVVQHNLTAMNSNRMLGLTVGSQAKSTEKLSSGYKINRAADDAAGLTISEKMRRQIRGLNQATLNAQDGISAVQTAEGALTEVHDMLQRMNELATKASNGSNSQSDREAIQNEVDQLLTEIDRVAETTKFNEMYLLKGDEGSRKITLEAHDAGLVGRLSDPTKNADGTTTVTFTREAFELGDKVSIGGKEYTIAANSSTEVVSKSGGKLYTKDDDGNIVISTKKYMDLDEAIQDGSDGNLFVSIKIKDGTEIEAADLTAEYDTSTGLKALAKADDDTKFYAVKDSQSSELTVADVATIKVKSGSELYENKSSGAVEKINAGNTVESGKKYYQKDSTISIGTTTGTDEHQASAAGKILNLSNSQVTTVAANADLSGSTFSAMYDSANHKLKDGFVFVKDAETANFEVSLKTPATGTTWGKELDGDEAASIDNLNITTGDEITATDAYDLIADELKQANNIGTSASSQATVTNDGNGKFTITLGSVSVSNTLEFNLHVGADADMTNKIGVKIDTMGATQLGINGLDVVGKDLSGKNINDNGKAATYAIDAIQDALSKVSAQRSALGAIQNRLEHTVNNLGNVVENTTAAESQIRDTDMATEMVKYANNNILAQAGQSMLAQANQSNQGVLSLLG